MNKPIKLNKNFMLTRKSKRSTLRMRISIAHINIKI